MASGPAICTGLSVRGTPVALVIVPNSRHYSWVGFVGRGTRMRTDMMAQRLAVSGIVFPYCMHIHCMTVCFPARG